MTIDEKRQWLICNLAPFAAWQARIPLAQYERYIEAADATWVEKAFKQMTTGEQQDFSGDPTDKPS